MSKLHAFLHPVSPVDRQEVVVSKRFQNEDGTPAPFVVRPITQEENERLIKASTRREKVDGRVVERLDSTEYGHRVVVAATVEPNFSDEEMCKAYGAVNPLDVPGKMLLTGEYDKLSRAILELSGLNEDVGEAAKN